MSCARATDRTEPPCRYVSSTICRFSAVLRIRRIEIDELVASNGVVGRDEAREQLEELNTENVVSLRLGHVPLRVRRWKSERLHRAHVP